nr:metalloprotease PmbA [Kingella potus]
MMFTHSPQELSDLCALALDAAKQKGATAAEADLSESVGQNVQVRLQETEHIEHQQDKSLDITVYLGQSKGRASTADFSRRAVEETVQAALDIARHTAQDDCAGLADAELMAHTFGDLDKYHQWDLSVEEAVALARRCEAAALAADPRVKNSEGADIQTSHYQFAYGNSHGFLQHERGTRHSISCSVVAEDGSGAMQRDYWYDLARAPEELDSMEAVGRTAAERTVRRLNAASLSTRSCPVLFDTTVSGSLIGHLVGALSGGALYRQSSFLTDSLGRQILPAGLSLREEPHIPRAWGSTWFDSEGVATRPRFVIEDGVIQGYFLSSYSARKLGLHTTGNAGGAHNLILSSTCPTQADLLRQMGSGLLVTELMGQGVNMLTGDYSRGAAGFWVENGVIQYPVEEITVAGRLQDMFADIAGVAGDALRRTSHKVGSILIGNMTVAGQ